MPKGKGYEEPWMKAIIKEFGAEGKNIIAEILGLKVRDPKTGVKEAKGGLAMKNGGVKIRGKNVTKEMFFRDPKIDPK